MLEALWTRIKADANDVHTVYVYFLFPFLTLVGYVAVFYFNLPWVLVFITYGMIPKLDQILKHDLVNPTLEEIDELGKSQKFRAVLYVTLVMDWVVTYTTMNHICSGNCGFFEFFPLTFMTMNFSASVFLVSHELMHKLNMTDYIFGNDWLKKVLYMHFTIQHLLGHHKRVATPEDPATARKGISLYEFVPKSIYGSYLSAFGINPIMTILSTVASVVMLALVHKFFGIVGLLYFTVMAAGGIFILELINYIEHYGLMRKRLENGTYEKVTIRHSWNASHRISNYAFFKLQRHSDHHQNSYKPYQTLCTYQDSPQLPHGYLVCLMIACSPKHWFDMMDPLVDEYAKSDKGTNLKALAEAEAKADAFVDRLYLFISSMMLLELIIKYGF